MEVRNIHLGSWGNAFDDNIHFDTFYSITNNAFTYNASAVNIKHNKDLSHIISLEMSSTTTSTCIKTLAVHTFESSYFT